MSDDFEIEQNVSTVVIAPGDLLEDPPSTVEEGYYLARLAAEGVGNASYVVLPYTGGASANSITIGDGGVLYVRTRVQDDEVLYRVRNLDSADAWAAQEE